MQRIIDQVHRLVAFFPVVDVANEIKVAVVREQRILMDILAASTSRELSELKQQAATNHDDAARLFRVLHKGHEDDMPVVALQDSDQRAAVEQARRIFFQKIAAYSTAFRPPIPGDSGHGFHFIPASDSMGIRPVS